MLSDLDELVLKCRDERAKTYLREAVACYKAGAYRSAIISTWIAVAFDIVDKVYEVSLAGDKAAEAFIKEFQSVSADSNPSRLLMFERDLLTKARDPFELISAQEFSELERLREDRHRCAHPSRVSYTDIFTPSAELARLHIRVAVECLLQHEPAQGKAALKMLLRDIQSKHFPTDQQRASDFLNKSPLRRGRASLARNLLIVLVKSSLDIGTDYSQRNRDSFALTYILQTHSETAIKVLTTELSRLYRGLDSDEQLALGARLLMVDQAFPTTLEQDQLIRIQQFIRLLPPPELWFVDEFAKVPQLKEFVLRRVSIVSPLHIKEAKFFMLPDLIRQHVAREFVGARRAATADEWGKIIGGSADEFDPEEVRNILVGAALNQTVRECAQMPKVIGALRAQGKMAQKDFNPLVEALNQAAGHEVFSLQVSEFDDDIPF